MTSPTTTERSARLVALLFAALTATMLFAMAAPLAAAYPAVTIVTEGNTYTGSAPSTVTSGGNVRVIVPNSPYPYVSGPEYTYWPRTADYVDGYRDGYAWGRNDDRYDCDRYSGSRYRDCRDRFYDRYFDCDRYSSSRRDDCRDYFRYRFGELSWTYPRAYSLPGNVWYSTSAVARPVTYTYTYTTVPAYGYGTYGYTYPRYW